jgi:multidrug efflux system membrane fusion protein
LPAIRRAILRGMATSSGFVQGLGGAEAPPLLSERFGAFTAQTVRTFTTHAVTVFEAHTVGSLARALTAHLAATVLRFAPAVLAAMLAACATPAAQSAPPPPPAVTAAHAVARDITEWSEFTGRLEAVHKVDVRPRVSGLVAAVHFTEGAIVHRGDVLFEIDPRPFQAEVDRLGAELARARATLTRANAERDRAERLARENAMSGEEHDRRVSAAVEAAAQLSAVDAALRSAQLNLDFTRVVAPISGRVGHAIVTEGNLVSSGPGEATLLTTLVSLDPMYAYFEVDEQSFLSFTRRDAATSTSARRGSRPSTPLELPRASVDGRSSPRVPTTVHMALAGEDDFPREGRIDFFDNQLDAATGTIRVRAVFANPDGALTPGLFVRLRMPGSASYRGVVVQDQAIGTDLDKRFVYVIGPDQTVAYRPVTLGPIVDGLRVVRAGVQPDELVVVNGLQRVRPGAKVTPSVHAMEAVQ